MHVISNLPQSQKWHCMTDIPRYCSVYYYVKRRWRIYPLS